MKKYISVLQDINKHVSSFNNFLNENYKVSLLEEDQILDDSYVLNLNGKTWNDVKFPRNCTVTGVYFYFGYSEKTPEKLCVYVGKASLSRATGQRLWNHFHNAFDENGIVFKTGSNGDRYIIEAITLIPFETEGMACFSPALEEYPILELAKEEKYELINKRGNG